MAGKGKEKTNATRKLDSLKIQYQDYELELKEAVSGVEIAELLHKDSRFIYKTLVTSGKSGAHYVFVIPAPAELDLKKAAQAVGEKSIEMLKAKDLLPLTGYVHGGCSPVGMKKQFRTIIDKSVEKCELFFVSGGRIGYQIEVSFEQLSRAVPLELAFVTV